MGFDMAIHPLGTCSPPAQIANFNRCDESQPGGSLSADLSATDLAQQLHTQLQQQKLISRLVNAIRNNQDLNQIYQETVDSLVQTTQINRGMLLLFKYSDPYRRKAGALVLTRATVVAEAWSVDSFTEHWRTPDADSPVSSAFSFTASDCEFCREILQGQPQVLSTTLALSLRPDPLFQIEHLPMALLLPLESQGTILGCLVLQQQPPRQWSETELEFLQVVTAQLSTAIIQTRSFQQVQGVVQERTAQLQRSLEVQAKLYEKTRQQVEQLRKLNEEREEFLSTISHELLTPLTSMMLSVRMLRQTNLDDSRRLKYLDILEQQCVQETNLINDMLALRKLEMGSSSTSVQKIELRQFVQEVMQSLEASWQAKELKLHLNLPPQPLMLLTDRESLHRILVELLTNARKYSESSTTVELAAAMQGDVNQRQLVLTVRNLGAGIAPDELPHIFEKFRRGRGVTKQAIQGTGLGLALIKSLVEHLEGSIAASSQPMANSSLWETCFTVSLPQNGETQLHAIA